MEIDSYVSSHLAVIKGNNEKVLDKYLFYLLKKIDTKDLVANPSYPSLNLDEIEKIEIPIPDLITQREIIFELDSYQKIIEGCEQVVKNYKPIINIEENWNTVEIGEVLVLAYGKGLTEDKRIDGDFNVYGSNGIVGTHNKYSVEGPFIIVGRKGSAGELHFSKDNGNPIDTTFYISKKQLKKDIDLELLFYLLKNIDLTSFDDQSAVPGINRNNVYKLKISLPPKDSQHKILKIIKDEIEIIDKNKYLIKIFKKKLNEKIDKIWSH
jgi:restriction endonuclease S subunit